MSQLMVLPEREMVTYTGFVIFVPGTKDGDRVRLRLSGSCENLQSQPLMNRIKKKSTEK